MNVSFYIFFVLHFYLYLEQSNLAFCVEPTFLNIFSNIYIKKIFSSQVFIFDLIFSNSGSNLLSQILYSLMSGSFCKSRQCPFSTVFPIKMNGEYERDEGGELAKSWNRLWIWSVSKKKGDLKAATDSFWV